MRAQREALGWGKCWLQRCLAGFLKYPRISTWFFRYIWHLFIASSKLFSDVGVCPPVSPSSMAGCVPLPNPAGCGKLCGSQRSNVRSAIMGAGLGKYVALMTDGRFSGGSHGFIIGHVSPEADHADPRSRDGWVMMSKWVVRIHSCCYVHFVIEGLLL